eukprot:3936010-Rhodomonas_salina.1
MLLPGGPGPPGSNGHQVLAHSLWSYAATRRCPILIIAGVCCSLSPYVMSGTDLAYGRTSALCDGRY